MTDEETRRQRAEEVELVREMLLARVEDVAAQLLPEGRRVKNDWRAGSRGSKSIALKGANRGVYRDFESSDRPCDLLGAIQRLLCNGSFRDAMSWSRAYLGLEGVQDKALEQARREAARRARAAEREAAQDLAKRQRIARGIWRGAQPIAGTPAARYLKGRGVDLDKLARPPGALRYSADVWCSTRRGKFPAMVSSLWRFDAPELVATHRTFLSGTGEAVDKADVDPVRSILGPWPGALIPLQRGETGARWKDIEEGELVAFGEGIEEGLSVALVKPQWRVGAVGFVGNFREISLPVWCHLVLAVNNDPPGSEAHVAIHGGRTSGGDEIPGAIAELEAAGHAVAVARPPEDFKDWNDFLRGKRRG